MFSLMWLSHLVFLYTSCVLWCTIFSYHIYTSFISYKKKNQLGCLIKYVNFCRYGLVSYLFFGSSPFNHFFPSKYGAIQ